MAPINAFSLVQTQLIVTLLGLIKRATATDKVVGKSAQNGDRIKWSVTRCNDETSKCFLWSASDVTFHV